MSTASEPGLETPAVTDDPAVTTAASDIPATLPAATPSPDHAADTAPLPEGRFPVDVPGYRGTLEDLVSRANRGDIDLSGLPVSEITAGFRRQLRREEAPPDLRALADFLLLASRLIALKAQSAMPDPNAVTLEEEPELDPATDAGRRLAEYRLFRAAAEALLADVAEDGARSFLGMVAADVVPVERLRIPPERLAAAFRSVLERLAAVEPIGVGIAAFSVEEMTTRLRARLAQGGRMDFDALFAEVTSRLEAVAVFLGLLELLRNGEAEVNQAGALAPIMVIRCG